MPALSLVYPYRLRSFLNSTLLTLMDMNKSWNAITAIPTLASLLLVLLDYLFPLDETIKLLIYIFDLFVVILLARFCTI